MPPPPSFLKESRDFLAAGSLPKCMQQPHWGRGHGPRTQPRPPLSVAAAQPLESSPLPPRVSISGKLGLRMQPGFKSKDPDVNCRPPTSDLTIRPKPTSISPF